MCPRPKPGDPVSGGPCLGEAPTRHSPDTSRRCGASCWRREHFSLCRRGAGLCLGNRHRAHRGPDRPGERGWWAPRRPSRPQPHEAGVSVVQKAPGAPGVSDVRLVRPFPGAQTPRAGGWAAAGPRCPGAPRAWQTEQGRLEREPPLPWGAPAPLCASWVLWNSSERK